MKLPRLYFVYVCYLLAFFLSPGIFAQNLSTSIESAIAHTLPTASVGIIVTDANTNKVLYERNSYQDFIPASNIKLLTASAALFYLGDDYRYKTSVSTKAGRIKKGVLSNNVYIKFTGDPTFRVKDLQNLLAKLKAKGISQIKSNIILDDSRFSRPYYAPGWVHDSINWGYSAPISAILLDQNHVKLTIAPNARLGGAVKFIPDKGMQFMTMSADVKTVTEDKANGHCSLLLDVDQNNHIKLGGCWPISDKAKTVRLAIKNPEKYAGDVIQNYLKQNKIRFTGKILIAKQPKGQRLIAEKRSLPMSIIVKHMLQTSDNVYAEAVLKTLGYKMYRQGTFQQGVRAMESIIGHTAHINFDNAELFDGSGQSRYDLVTPRQMAKLLYVIYNSGKINNSITELLPDSGVDGTLRYRMNGFDLAKHVQAKTGTMGNISALSGYITTMSKKRLIFSIIINNVVGSERVAMDLQNQICYLLYRS